MSHEGGEVVHHGIHWKVWVSFRNRLLIPSFEHAIAVDILIHLAVQVNAQMILQQRQRPHPWHLRAWLWFWSSWGWPPYLIHLIGACQSIWVLLHHTKYLSSHCLLLPVFDVPNHSRVIREILLVARFRVVLKIGGVQSEQETWQSTPPDGNPRESTQDLIAVWRQC